METEFLFSTNMKFPFYDCFVLHGRAKAFAREIVFGLRNQFIGLLEFCMHDSRDLLVLLNIGFSSVSTPYSVHICFRQYLFLYLFPFF